MEIDEITILDSKNGHVLLVGYIVEPKGAVKKVISKNLKKEKVQEAWNILYKLINE